MKSCDPKLYEDNFSSISQGQSYWGGRLHFSDHITCKKYVVNLVQFGPKTSVLSYNNHVGMLRNINVII
jgi:hypothetical protein